MFLSCTPKKAQTLLQPAEALGVVLAEETAHAAGNKKQIALIVPNSNWGPKSTVEQTFRAELKKRGLSVAGSKSADLGDPMRSSEIGLKPADFLEVAQKFPNAGAIVSLCGAPELGASEAAKLGSSPVPVLIVATMTLGNALGVPSNRADLAHLLNLRVIELAIIDGADPLTAEPVKGDAMRQLFAQHYRILRRRE
jgi:hypothetical protein